MFLLLTSCDKIAEDEYTIYSVAGTWTSGSGVATPVQRAFLEKYTGPRCTNCPAADVSINEALSSFGEKLIAISIVDSSTFGNPYSGHPDLRTDDGNIWSKYLGITQYPSALINRAKKGGAWDIMTAMDGVNAKVSGCISQSPSVAVEMSCPEHNTISINLELLRDNLPSMTLTLAIIEDSIVAKQATPTGHIDDYVSNHMLRDVITGPWGADFHKEDNGGNTLGNKINVLFEYQPKEEWNLEHCKYVVLISNKATREVINCAECHAL